MTLQETYAADPFPFETGLSFRPVLAFWKSEARSEDSVRASVARQVLESVEHVKALHAETIPVEEARGFESEVRGLLSALFPPALWESVLFAAFPPFRLDAVVASPGFRTLDPFSLINHCESAGTRTSGGAVSADGLMRMKAMAAYSVILKRFYNVNLQADLPVMFEQVDSESGLERFFRIKLDPRFVEVHVDGALPELTTDDIAALIARPNDLDFWKATLPAESFSFRGIGTMSAEDATADESVSRLKQNLLAKDALLNTSNAVALQGYIRSHLNLPDIRLGVIALDRCESGQVSGARSMGSSILLDKGLPVCSRPKESVYFDVIERQESIVTENISELDRDTGFEYRLVEEGIVSLFLAPLISGNSVIGVLEIGSPHVGDLNRLNAGGLRELTSIFSTALRRSLDEQEDRVQALIKKQYTAIHPIVEWRFRKAALDHISAMEDGSDAEWTSIRFNDVIPMYGMSDIRRSSLRRSEAIQSDLTEQLGLALAVIISASTERPRPALDELGFRLSDHIERVLSGLASGDESAMLELLQQEVEPLFEGFATYSPAVARQVKQYRDALDPELGIIYADRKKYEQSVMLVNDTISSILEDQQQHAQEMVPHYFERFRTDGVDYNMYAGASLLEAGGFTDLDLSSLRLWQLTSTARIADAIRQIRPILPVPLDVAHLILVQSEPLSIRFREDEKKFDVDGAYNIRYEIIKKRIDKAHVAGSTERVTQPDHVAIIYAHERERNEYLRHVKYLTAAGYFEGTPEHLLLEDLPGASGLRAIRVRIATNQPHAAYFSIPDPSDVRGLSQETLD